jgi:hypothetical protein
MKPKPEEILRTMIDMAWLEARVETDPSKQEIWLKVKDWAEGYAGKMKINLSLLLAPRTADRPGKVCRQQRKHHPSTLN